MEQIYRKLTKKMIWMAIIGIVCMIAVSASSKANKIDKFGDNSKEKIIVFPNGGGTNSSANFSIENGANVIEASMDISGGMPNGSIYPYNLSFEINETLWMFEGIGYGAMGHQNIFEDNDTFVWVNFDNKSTKNAGYILLPKGKILHAYLNISNILLQKFKVAHNISNNSNSALKSVALGDIDNDGDIDIVGSATDGNFYVSLYGYGKYQNLIKVNATDQPMNDVELGDVDNDGDLDIAGANEDYRFWIAINNNGSYEDAKSYDAGNDEPMRCVALGDFDNDGDLDIAGGSENGNFYFMENNGDGTFGNADYIYVPTSTDMLGVVFGDVNNDRDLDLIGANQNGDYYISINQNGDFNFANRIDSGADHSMKSIAVGDVDLDGDLDIVGANADFRFYVALNTGQEGLSYQTFYVEGGKDEMLDVALGDIDNDGDLDILGTNKDNNYYVSINNNTNFLEARKISSESKQYMLGLALKDIDNDGDVDIIGANADGYFYLSVNNYSAEYSYNLKIDTTSIWKRETLSQPLIEAYGVPYISQTDAMYSVALGDIDNDGDIDIAGANADTNFYISINNNGNFENAERVETNAQNAMRGVALGDIDNDGDLDLVGANGDGDFWIALNNDGSFQTPISVNSTASEEMYSVDLGDCNKDGDIDIVGSNKDGNFYICYGQGNGNFANGIMINSSATKIMRFVTLGDLNNDGYSDIVGANDDGKFYICYYNKSIREFDNGTMVETSITTQMYSVAVEDIDNDGDLDIAGVNKDKKFYIAYNNRNNDWKVDFVDSEANKELRSVSLGDINNDGNIDLVGASEDKNFYVSIYENGFKKAILVRSGAEYEMYSVALGDVDNDGNLDMVGANGDTSFYISMNNWGNFQTKTDDFTTKLQDYINNTTPQIDKWGNEICKIPFNITSEYTGTIILDNINITYNYTIHLSNFSSAINNYTKEHEPEHGDNITIPLNFTSKTTGKLWLGNVSIKYIPAPDLIVEKIEFLDNCTYDGKNTKILAEIKNKGESSAENIKIKFYLDNISNEIENQTIDELCGNETKILEINWSASKMLGDHEIIVAVDPENEILEVNETNNNKTLKTKDWKIVGDSNYENKTIVLSGNLTIENAGKLIFKNLTFEMNCSFDGEFHITVDNGGAFIIMDNDNNPRTENDASIITSYDQNYEYMFYVKNSGKLEMKNSMLHECGFDNLHKGLTIESDNVTILHNQISNNYFGLYLKNSRAKITQNEISNNEQDGIFLLNSNVSIYNNSIINNNNGINCQNDNSKIFENVIQRNLNFGIYSKNSKSEINANRISENIDGIVLNNSHVRILSSVIFENTNFGINCFYSNPIILNTTINNNVDDEIHLNNSNPIIDFCEITTDISGNGIFCAKSSPIVSNSTIQIPIENDFYITQDSHPTALNTNFNEDNVNIDDEESSLTVEWFLNVKVVHGDNSGAKNANVVIKDINEKEIINKDTDNDGLVKWIKCIEYIENRDDGQIFYTPHNITATYNDETLYSNVIMDESKDVILRLTEIELIIKSLKIKGNCMLDGSPTQIQAIVQNIGNKNASNINLSFYYIDSKEHLIKNLTISEELGANEEKDIYVEWNATSMLGDYKIKLVVDPENLINEVNEENNTKEINTKDWKIVGDIEYNGEGEKEILISGNIYIEAKLTFINLKKLWINYSKNEHYSIIVKNTGFLKIINSEIDANKKTSEGRYKFIVYGNLEISDSKVNYTWFEGNTGGIQIFSDNVLIENSKISNSDIGIYCYGSSPRIYNSTFENIKNYKIVLNSYASPFFINTTFKKDDVKFIDDDSKLLKGWFIDVKTIDESSNNVPFANVKVTDKNDNFKEYFTNKYGLIKFITVVELEFDKNWKAVMHTPHNISATNETLEGYKNIEINRSMIGEDKIIIVMYVANQPPVAVLKANKTIYLPNEDIEFIGDESYDLDGDNLTFKYDFGDGNFTDYGDEPNIIYNYNISKLERHEYEVRLYVKDEYGKESQDYLIIKLNNPPFANAEVSKKIATIDEEIEFDASSSYDLDEIDTLRFYWDFGDLYTGEGEYVSHSYSKEGKYAVKLIVNDSIEERNYIINITIKKNNKPVAKFTHNLGKDNTVKLKNGIAIVCFDASSSFDEDYDTLKYKWDFGDGEITEWIDDALIEHEYFEANDFKVILSVSDGKDVTDTSMIIHVVIYGVELKASREEITTFPNKTVSFEIEIKNTGSENQKDKFNISILQDDIGTSYLNFVGIRSLFIEINGQESEVIMLNASIPKNKNAGKYTITIIASSFNDETISTTLTLSVNVKVGEVVYSIEVSSKEKIVTLNEGERTATFTINVENRGSSNAKITLSMEKLPDGWSAKFSSSSFELTPQNSKDVILTLTIPQNAEAKSYSIVVKIISGDVSNPKTTDELTFTVIINKTIEIKEKKGEEFPIYAVVIPVVIIVIGIAVFVMKRKEVEKKKSAKKEKADKERIGETIIKCPKCKEKIEVPPERPITIRCPECNKESTLKE